MKSLKERQKQREHFAKVNSGEIRDPAVTHGTDEGGNVLGDDGKAVGGTAPKGFDANAVDSGGGNSPNDEGKTDYSKLRSHADLDGDKGLAGREKPEGWDDKSVADKQKWLSENQNTSNDAPAGGWGNQ